MNTGLRRRWFEEFRTYWEQVLEGRPLTVMDFHQLRFAYRRAAHYRDHEQLAWEATERHLANWQQPRHLFQTLDFVYRSALHPAWGGRMLFDLLRPGWTVLEYGCGIAPMYRTWRTFMSHVPTQWVLADIPGFAFHYARHLYGSDAEADLVLIEDFAEPLRGTDREYDLIILQTVLEHLDHPAAVVRYLLDRLRPGGLLWFDYVKSHGSGLDTPAGIGERRETLELLADNLEIVSGALRIDERSLGTTIGRKRP